MALYLGVKKNVGYNCCVEDLSEKYGEGKREQGLWIQIMFNCKVLSQKRDGNFWLLSCQLSFNFLSME